MNLFSSHYFSNVHFVLVVVHVLTALLSLVVAPLVMIVKKGGRTHRSWGKVYFWGMFVANMTAIVLLFYRFNIFLLGVTVLSFYGAITGYRVLYRKRPQNGRGANWFDWGAAVVALVTGVALIGTGLLLAFGVNVLRIPGDGGIPLFIIILPLLFGFFVSNNAVVDLKSFLRPSTDRNWWWYYHMDRMLGSYIGLTTAFMVQQVGPRLPESVAWIVWVAPAVIGSVLIARWIGSYRKQFSGRVEATV